MRWIKHKDGGTAPNCTLVTTPRKTCDSPDDDDDGGDDDDDYDYYALLSLFTGNLRRFNK